jgi:6-pyruvoyl-tetrahydropterin synthase
VYEITVDRSFTALHSLPLPTGEMEPKHDHHWHVTAGFRSNVLDEVMGVVIDFLAVDGALKAICHRLEGSDLNALPAFADGKASAERVAQSLADTLRDSLAEHVGDPDSGRPWLAFLRVTEAPGCAATFFPYGVA